MQNTHLRIISVKGEGAKVFIHPRPVLPVDAKLQVVWPEMHFSKVNSCSTRASPTSENASTSNTKKVAPCEGMRRTPREPATVITECDLILHCHYLYLHTTMLVDFKVSGMKEKY